MRRIFFAIAVILAVPFVAQAHGMMNFNQVNGGLEMMSYVEEQSMGPELHEEMESLMTKMMAGDMSEEEAGRMTELMNQYPGPSGMMMNRMMDAGSGWGMMPWSFGGFGAGAFWLLYLVWLVAGVLAVIWLYKNIVKK